MKAKEQKESQELLFQPDSISSSLEERLLNTLAVTFPASDRVCRSHSSPFIHAFWFQRIADVLPGVHGQVGEWKMETEGNGQDYGAHLALPPPALKLARLKAAPQSSSLPGTP